MREVKRSALVNKPPAELFALINDIESYPQFLPWCTQAQGAVAHRLRDRRHSRVRQGALHGEFTTRNTLEPPLRIHMQLVSGPFRTLEGEWLLTPIEARLPRGADHALCASQSPQRAALRAEVRRDDRLAGGCVRRARALAAVSAASAGRPLASAAPSPTRRASGSTCGASSCRPRRASRRRWRRHGPAPRPRPAARTPRSRGTRAAVGIFGEPRIAQRCLRGRRSDRALPAAAARSARAAPRARAARAPQRPDPRRLDPRRSDSRELRDRRPLIGGQRGALGHVVALEARHLVLFEVHHQVPLPGFAQPPALEVVEVVPAVLSNVAGTIGVPSR